MIWLTLSGMACITFFNRVVFLLQWLAYKPNDKLTRFLSFSSLAVLTAIWVPIVFQASSGGELGIAGWDYLIGTLVAAILSLLRAHSLLVVLLSSGVFFLIRFYF